MRAGPLTRRVLLERSIGTQDATGQEVRTWEPVAVVWASIEPIRGSEALRAGQILADMDTRISMRYSSSLSSLDATHRVLHGNVIYDIVSVANQRAGNIMLELMCKSGLHADAASTWLVGASGEFLTDASGSYLTA